MGISSQTNSTTEYLQTSVNLASTDIKNMYATPVLAIASPNAHTAILVHTSMIEFLYVAPIYTAGSPTGQIYLQYGNTAHAAGPTIIPFQSVVNNTASIIATDWMYQVQTSTASTIVGQSVYLTNPVAAYATGNGTAIVNIFYSIVNTLS